MRRPIDNQEGNFLQMIKMGYENTDSYYEHLPSKICLRKKRKAHQEIDSSIEYRQAKEG